MGPDICCCSRAANQNELNSAAAIAAAVIHRYPGQSSYMALKGETTCTHPMILPFCTAATVT